MSFFQQNLIGQDNWELRGTNEARIRSLEAGLWTDYTPTWTQSVTVTHTVTRARYVRLGRFIRVELKLVATGAGSVGSTLFVSVPVTAAVGSVGGSLSMPLGVGSFRDASASQNYYGFVFANSTTVVGLTDINTNGSSLPADAIASGDELAMSFMYEAAS